jgi:hypothetical protein
MKTLRFAGLAAAALVLGACGSSHEQTVTTVPRATSTATTKPHAKTTTTWQVIRGPSLAVGPSAAQLAPLQSQLSQLSGDLTGASTDLAGADVNSAKSQEGSAP